MNNGKGRQSSSPLNADYLIVTRFTWLAIMNGGIYIKCGVLACKVALDENREYELLTIGPSWIARNAAEPRPRKEYLPHDAFHVIVLAVVGVFACWHWGKLRNMSALTKPRSLPLYNQDPTVSKFPLCIINQPNLLLLHLTCDTGLVFVLCDFYLYKIKIHRNTFVATTKKKIRRMIG